MKKALVPITPARAPTTQLNSLNNPDAALTAMRTYLHSRRSDAFGFYGTDARHVEEAKQFRNQRLQTWRAMAAAKTALDYALDHRNIDKPQAVQIIGFLLHALATKPGDAAGLLDGAMVALFDAVHPDDWIMICPTGDIIKAAARWIIRNKIYAPKGAEVFKACCEQTQEFKRARRYCDEWLTDFQRADAVLLEFAHDEWKRPYLMPQYQELFSEMLERHECAAEKSRAFRKLVAQEVDKYEAAQFAENESRAGRNGRTLIPHDDDDDMTAVEEKTWGKID